MNKPGLQYFIRQHLQPFLARLRVPRRGRITRKLLDANTLSTNEPLDEQVRNFLLQLYANDIRRTAQLTGLDLAGYWL